MQIVDKETALREHLALISTEVYLMMRTKNDDERLKRYNTVQEQIDQILALVKDDVNRHNPLNDTTLSELPQ